MFMLDVASENGTDKLTESGQQSSTISCQAVVADQHPNARSKEARPIRRRWSS